MSRPAFLQNILWRPLTFTVLVNRSAVTSPPTIRVPIYSTHMLVVALELYADNNNSMRIAIGNQEVNWAASFATNSYFQLDAGRHAFLWVDNYERESIDLAQYYAAEDTSIDIQRLHVTAWQPTGLGRGVL